MRADNKSYKNSSRLNFEGQVKHFPIGNHTLFNRTSEGQARRFWLEFRLNHFKRIWSPQGDAPFIQIQIFRLIFEMVDSPGNKNTNTSEVSDGRGQHSEPAPIVLIVDDNDDSRLMLKLLLEMWKYEVVEATDGGEALALAEKTCPALILMDVKMPNLDGFAVTRKIRQSAKTENVPIVFLSGCAEASYKQKAAAVGGDEYLVKPLDFQELENTLGKYISHSPEV